MKNFIAAILLLSSFSAAALERELVTITSNVNDKTTTFYLEVKEDGAIDSMRFVSRLPNGGISEDVTVSLEEVEADGAVLFRQSGRDIVRLNVSEFDPYKGGNIKLDYLYNGVLGTRRFMRLQLLQGADGLHQLTHNERGVVTHMKLMGNWTAFGLVGIRQILINPAPRSE